MMTKSGVKELVEALESEPFFTPRKEYIKKRKLTWVEKLKRMLKDEKVP